MANWGEDDLTRFYDLANNETRETFNTLPAAHEGLLEIDQAFRLFQTEKVPMAMADHPVPALLGANAQSMFLAACRTAMSGHAGPTYAILRGCLESALYALHMVKNPNVVQIWLNRSKSAEAENACRNEFTAARVKRTALDANEELGHYVEDIYSALLDFGAHPNTVGVLRHVRTHDVAEGMKVELAVLHGNSPQKTEALVACIEIGSAALVALVEAFPKRAAEIGLDAAVQELFDQREATMKAIVEQAVGSKAAGAG